LSLILLLCIFWHTWRRNLQFSSHLYLQSMHILLKFLTEVHLLLVVVCWILQLVYVIHWVHIDRFDSPEHAYKDGKCRLDLLVARLQAVGG
jgi:hypothetical protein